MMEVNQMLCKTCRNQKICSVINYLFEMHEEGIDLVVSKCKYYVPEQETATKVEREEETPEQPQDGDNFLDWIGG